MFEIEKENKSLRFFESGCLFLEPEEKGLELCLLFGQLGVHLQQYLSATQVFTK